MTYEVKIITMIGGRDLKIKTKSPTFYKYSYHIFYVHFFVMSSHKKYSDFKYVYHYCESENPACGQT